MTAVATKMTRDPGIVTETGERHALGWLADYPDFRDYTWETKAPSTGALQAGATDSVHSLRAKTGVTAPPATLPATTDLRPWCSPVEDQLNLGSCTANAGVGAIEYFERRAFANYIDASRLFLYKATRDTLHWTGDTGAYLRSTMGALALFGVPPEEFWPYNVASFDQEPSAFCYAYADNYKAINYFRLDPVGTSQATLLQRVKTNLAAYLPSIFGFTGYSSIAQAATTGKLPYPVRGERVLGG